MLINQTNQGFETQVLTEPYLRLAVGAAVINTDMAGNMALDKFAYVGRSKIGRYVGVGCFSLVMNCHIGRYCAFGSRVSVGAFSHPTDWLSIHEFQYRDTNHVQGESILDGGVNIAPQKAPTVIGNDVWIGDNACVRAGIKVGDGAIIGMGAAVTSDVPPYAIMVGNPARVLRYRFGKLVIKQLLDLRWWEMDISELAGVDFSDVQTAIENIRRRRAT